MMARASSEDNVSVELESSSSSDEPVLVPRNPKRKRKRYLDISDLRVVFLDATPGILRRLSEAWDGAPSRILDIVPPITSQQLEDYGKLAKAKGTKLRKLGDLDSTGLLEAINQAADNRLTFFLINYLMRRGVIVCSCGL